MTDIQQVEQTPEPWSEEDGSVATWIDEVFVNSSQLYYPKGALTGMLLDVTIRDATDNVHSLDDVMRALYARYFLKGKGFTTEHLLSLLREFGMPDVDAFYQHYINGRDPLPYDTVLPKAGINVEKTVTSVPFLGVVAPLTDDGKWQVQMVEPGSAAQVAGVAPGDVLVKIGEVDTQGTQDWSAAFRRRYQGQAGAPLNLIVQRGGKTLTLATRVQEHTSTAFSLSRSTSPTAKQTKIWLGLATGTTGG
jgi:predicted metalloprotease with PDZ domain